MSSSHRYPEKPLVFTSAPYMLCAFYRYPVLYLYLLSLGYVCQQFREGLALASFYGIYRISLNKEADLSNYITVSICNFVCPYYFSSCLLESVRDSLNVK